MKKLLLQFMLDAIYVMFNQHVVEMKLEYPH